MKILVAVKRVVDYNVAVRVRADGSGVETANVKMSMNPFDEIALEEAVRLKERGAAHEVVAVSIGPEAARETLRAALALGADRAILVRSDLDPDGALQPLGVAKVLAALSAAEAPDLVLLGKQAIDDDSNQAGQMLAALLGWPQATFVSKLTVNGGRAETVREIDGGLETLIVDLPAVATADLRLNEPRFASLPNIMKAKRKTIEETTPEALGADVAPRLDIVEVTEPPRRQAGARVADAAELLDRLRAAKAL